MTDLYTEDVIDHSENPRNFGEIKGEGVITVRDSNASCGDMVQFFVIIGESNDPSQKLQVIKEVKWKGVGCAVTTAAASKLSMYILGQTLEHLRQMSDEQMIKEGVGFEVNPGRIKCLTLPVRVVREILMTSTPKT